MRQHTRPANEPRQHALRTASASSSHRARIVAAPQTSTSNILAGDPDSPRGRQSPPLEPLRGKTISTRPAWHTGSHRPGSRTIGQNGRRCHSGSQLKRCRSCRTRRSMRIGQGPPQWQFPRAGSSRTRWNRGATVQSSPRPGLLWIFHCRESHSRPRRVVLRTC